MMSFRKRFLSLAMVAGLAAFGVACDDDNGADDPAIEEPADDGLGEDDGLGDDDMMGDDDDMMDDEEDL